MKFDKNKFLTTIAAAALALAVGACSSSSDDDSTLAAAPPPAPGGDTVAPAPLTELQTAQADAAAAAAAAMTASTDAADAVAAAMTAIANLATMQTNATAADLAGEAQTAADKAKLAYEHAKAASEAAAEAEDVTAAVEARVMAENAMASAVTYGTTATDKAGEAETAAMAELMIVDTVKSVGSTDLDAEAGASVVVTGEGEDAQTVRTGLIKSMNPMTTGDGVTVDDALTGVQDDPATDDSEAVKHSQAVADRTFAIGKVVEPEDDTARLMIVTKYAGSKTVKVFAYSESVNDADLVGTKVGFVTVNDDDPDTTDTNNTALKSVGSYYLAGTNDETNGLTHDDVVGTMAKAESLYSYVSTADNPATADVDETVVTYLMRHETSTVGATTTYTYRTVDVEVTVVAAGEEAAFETQVTAKIPEATDYKHIHFGVWAALGDPEKDGSQKLSDLGIGFVQNFSGEGLTPIGGGSDDMPNNGMATYNGNWVAAVQRADEDGNGAINLRNGDATVIADFEKDTVSAALDKLATLSGKISGNEFSGEKASGINAEHGLDADGTFMGSFSGGFYGAKAAEAGGVFDFTSEDAEAGAFRGAFGGDRK